MHVRIAIVGLVWLIGQCAYAVITAPLPLDAAEAPTAYIFVGKVKDHYPEKPAMMVVVVEDIKGKAPFRSLPINLFVADPKTRESNQIEPLLKRFGPNLEIVFLVSPRGKGLVTFAYTNGTWFQLRGVLESKDEARFQLLSAEPYLRKTFSGSTDELRKLLKDHVAGKAKLPTKIDEKVEPGLGPEYAPKKSSRAPLTPTHFAVAPADGPLFAVIPTIGLGAPLAILAILFPSVFGGVFVLFRQWMAFITLLSVNSTILLLHVLFADALPRGHWWGTTGAAWIVMSLTSCACTFWAWRRQLKMLADGEPEAPARTELAMLGFMSAACVITTGVMGAMLRPIPWSDLGWTLTVVMTLAILAGTTYRFWSAVRTPGPFAAPAMTTEGVIVAAMLLGHVLFAPLFTSGGVDGSAKGTQQASDIDGEIAPVIQKWVYTAPITVRGMFASSPLIDGNNIYASYSDSLHRATLVKLDRQSGLLKWEYIGGDDGDLRQMISTPCIADGRLYFGEGFHDDQRCHLFCVDADKGDELWRFRTEGQTESSPMVANGNVFIGAGNDGVYCLDVLKSLAMKKGVVSWHFPPKDYTGRLLRFGGGLVVNGNRLYCATGVDRNQKKDKGETAVFCLDATTGKELWRTPAPFPVWSTPIVRAGDLFVASGNGDVFSDAEAPDTPGGALQCLDAVTGKEKWRVAFANGIIDSPAVDGHRIYLACRDGHAYAISRSDGAELWRRFLQSPIIATPLLDCDAQFERSLSVFFLTTDARLCCLSPKSGDISWAFDLTNQRGVNSTSPRLVVNRTVDGYTRQIYFGVGVGGGMDVYANRPAFYCLEDKVLVK